MIERCRRGRALSVTGVLVLAACGPPGDGSVPCGSLDPRSEDEVALCNGLEQAVIARVALPEGEPPAQGWPGVVVLHGSGGLFEDPESGDEVCAETMPEQFNAWATTLTAEGYAVIFPSSFYSRGFCTTHKGLKVPREFDPREQLVQRSFDAAAAADWLCEDPRVDCSRLAALGFSNGASTTLLLTLDDPSVTSDPRLADIADSASLVGAVAYYPGCGLEQLLSTEIDGSEFDQYYYPYVDLWVPHGSRDRLLDTCEAVRDPQVDMVGEARGNSGDRFELEVFDKAKHSFDDFTGTTRQADEDARIAAQARTLELFASWFSPG